MVPVQWKLSCGYAKFVVTSSTIQIFIMTCGANSESKFAILTTLSQLPNWLCYHYNDKLHNMKLHYKHDKVHVSCGSSYFIPFFVP